VPPKHLYVRVYLITRRHVLRDLTLRPFFSPAVSYYKQIFFQIGVLDYKLRLLFAIIFNINYPTIPPQHGHRSLDSNVEQKRSQAVNYFAGSQECENDRKSVSHHIPNRQAQTH